MRVAMHVLTHAGLRVRVHTQARSSSASILNFMCLLCSGESSHFSPSGGGGGGLQFSKGQFFVQLPPLL